jgi:putative RNA 2'-phosphotransferase
MAYILRHAPWEYELELDEEGWVPLEHLLEGLRAEYGLADVSRADIEAVNRQSDKARYEVTDDRIRALYGHSVAGKLKKERATPPSVLYHGTALGTLPLIQISGLKPMGRQYVHLSTTQATALAVGRRKGRHVALLTIDSAAADAAGLPFYVGNDQTWLADEIPPDYIRNQQLT